MSDNSKKGNSSSKNGDKGNSASKGQTGQVRTFGKESGATALKGISNDIRIAKPKK